MIGARPLTDNEIRKAFVWLCVDDYTQELARHPKLRAEVDVFQPASMSHPDAPDAPRVLVLTGPRTVVEGLDAFLRALSLTDEEGAVWVDESPF